MNPLFASFPILRDPSRSAEFLVEAIRTRFRAIELQFVDAQDAFDQRILGVALVAVCANPTTTLDGRVVVALNELDQATAELPSVIWLDTLLIKVALDCSTRNGSGIAELCDNLNHHRASTRELITRTAWLARARLNPIEIVERCLFNVGASHGACEDGLLLLLAVCNSVKEFWELCFTSSVDFRNSERFGAFLETSNPEIRSATLSSTLRSLNAADPRMSHFIRSYTTLPRFERSVVARLDSISS